MFYKNVWDFWAPRYERLWVQKYSLGPTRKLVLDEIAKRTARSSPGTPVDLLDAGCGTGQLAEDIQNLLHRYDIRITGIDASPEMIRIAGSKNIPRTRFIPGDVLELPFSNERFDIVTCCHSFPYYPDKIKALRGLTGVLRQGGCLLLINASENSLYDRLVMKLVKLTTGPASYPSAGETEKMVKKAGARLLEQQKLNTALFVPSIILNIIEARPHDEDSPDTAKTS